MVRDYCWYGVGSFSDPRFPWIVFVVAGCLRVKWAFQIRILHSLAYNYNEDGRELEVSSREAGALLVVYQSYLIYQAYNPTINFRGDDVSVVLLQIYPATGSLAGLTSGFICSASSSLMIQTSKAPHRTYLPACAISPSASSAHLKSLRRTRLVRPKDLEYNNCIRRSAHSKSSSRKAMRCSFDSQHAPEKGALKTKEYLNKVSSCT